MSYVPLTYLQDLEALIAELALDALRAVRHLARRHADRRCSRRPRRERIAGALLNDIGPVLEPAGLARIRSYVGQERRASRPGCTRRARSPRCSARPIPDYAIEDWLAMAKRLCRLTPAGRIVYDYDMKIAEPFRVPGGEAGFDMWPAFESLARRAGDAAARRADPTCSTPPARRRWRARLPGLELVTVPRVGHAPTLDGAGERRRDRPAARARAGDGESPADHDRCSTPADSAVQSTAGSAHERRVRILHATRPSRSAARRRARCG